MRTHTLTLRDSQARDPGMTGGKGANLAELLRAGLPVPSGFVVTTTAYTEFIAANELSGDTAERARERIPRRPIPAEIADAVRQAYRELDAPAVAVRSSGTAEDLSEASFAGQHDTYLNIKGEQEVLDAVRSCWASLWTPRAVAYRQRAGIDENGLSLAVIVQAMVDAEWAGVMFTADPVSGRRSRLVIEAVPGLGEALVSGQADTHRRTVARNTGEALDTDSALPAGVPPKLTELGNSTATLFGTEQDIEWAYAGGECFLVQARPLTGLPAEPAEPSTRGGSRKRPRREQPGMSIQTLTDHLPYPPFPMDCSLFLRPLLRDGLDGLRTLGFSVPGVDDVLVEIDDGVAQAHPPRVRPRMRALARVPAAFPRLVSLLRMRPADWLARCHEKLTGPAHRIDEEDLTRLTEQELIERVRFLRDAQDELVLSRFGCLCSGMFADMALPRLLRPITGAGNAARLHADLMAALPTVTRKANRELDRLARIIRDTPELLRIYERTDPADIPAGLSDVDGGRVLLGEIEQYLRDYGHRQTVAPLPGFPPLRATPSTLHGLLAGLARTGAEESGADSEQERQQEAWQELGSARARPFRPLLRRVVRAARTGVGAREDTHYYLFLVPGAVLHRLLLELGGRLRTRGLLDEASDVFYLDMPDLTDPDVQRIHQHVTRRKAARERALRDYTAVPAELLPRQEDQQGLHGVPASRGNATGTVRIVSTESEFAKLGNGEVLVCPYTNPAWTPLFSLAGAVVADTGGAASHAAVVAREYGIPAVMSTGKGTTLLIDGLKVRVDGDNGTVTPLDGESLS